MPSLRQALLPFTIRNAARLPFYARFWEGVDLDAVSSPGELRRLPTLSKEEYRRSLMFDPEAVRGADYITHSTGTTGEVTWRHRTAAEAAVIRDLFGRAAAREEGGPLALAFRYDRHGMSMPVPSRARAIPIGLSDDDELRQSVKMLTRTYHFADGELRPTVLAGSSIDLAILAQAWLESRAPREECQVRVLQALGLTDAGLYRFLRAAFDGAEVVEKYSLSEIFGGATKVWPAASFVLDPYVVGEVVDEGGAPVAPGRVGELVLTELFPFVQMQPLVRYRTGDVVLLVEDGDEAFRFEWWGRRHECILWDSDGAPAWALGYRPVFDWLALQPLVARYPIRTHLTSVKSLDFDLPCVALSGGRGGEAVSVDVGVRVNPWFEPEAVGRLAEGLWAALRGMLAVPPEGVRVGLSFRHFCRPDLRLDAVGDAHSLRLPAAPLSGPAPTIPRGAGG